jgi:uncharacterized protein YvpB
MKKYIFFILVMAFTSIFFSTVSSAEAISSPLRITEIDSTSLKGSYSGNGIVQVYKGNELIGEGTVLNNTFTVPFNIAIEKTQLSVKSIDQNGFIQTQNVAYQPATIHSVNNRVKILCGQVEVGARVQAFVNGYVMNLKTLETSNGWFEFHPNDHLTLGTSVKVISEKNGVKSIIQTKVVASLKPDMPKVNSLSNTDLYITGTAEANSTAVFTIGKNRYTYKIPANGSFKYPLPNKKPLAAGTTVSIFIKDSLNNISDSVSVKIIDKVPPLIPTMEKITNKTFKLKGKTEANATVYIYRNAKHFKTVKVSASGVFIVGLPLQQAGAAFDFYAEDKMKNKSAKKRVIVTAQARPAKKLIYAPLIKQLPELPRGCEVTSLAMLLNHAGIKANKMTLAKQVKRDLTPLTYKDGKKYFGNPHVGFVGDMYSFRTPGFGVFHKPIADLGNRYLPGRIVDLSGKSFESVLNYVGAGHPVWVINTSTFNIVPSSYWQTWYTPQGPVRITMKEHSVLVTGYDSNYVYFNDPLDGMKNKKKPLKSFIDGWKQYGNQAISYF